MMGNSPLLRSVGVVVLAIVLMECGYRLVYWYWMSSSAPGQAAVSAAHLRFWLTATVIVGLGWIYLGWKVLVEDRAASKKKMVAKDKKTQV
jgi:hypothetical protein